MSMDHNQKHSFPKTFSKNEHENLPSNEEDANVYSLSDFNKSESCIIEICEITNNFDLSANDGVANICLESQQYRFGESKQENFQLIENNTNFSHMNISNENTAINLAMDSLYILQQGNPLDIWSPNCLLSVPPHTSVDKEIGNYLTTSNISGSESNASESDIITPDYITKYVSSVTEQNEVESFHSVTTRSGEEHKVMSEVRSKDAIFDNYFCMPTSFKASEKGIFLNNTNIQMTSGATGNCGISFGQRDEDVQVISQNGAEPLKQTLPGAQVSDNSSSKFSINGELLVPVNDKDVVAGPSSRNVEVKGHKNGRFVCSICGKGFGWKSQLVVHKRFHTGEKPFACDKCDKRYSQKCDLTRHLHSHTEEKPFACDKCDKIYYEKGSLTKHRRIHTGEKPFVCDECGKSFSWANSLNIHRLSHTGEKPYTCPTCGKAFSQRSHRERHYKNVHNKK